MIDSNVQLQVPSHISDNFQGVTEIVYGSLPNHEESTLQHIYLKKT